MNIRERIADLGVAMSFTSELPENWLGCYLDDSQIILVRHGLTFAEEQETLHHEYAHAFYRDRASTPRTERRADRIAAQMLIRREDYARAERINPNMVAIARELGCTLRMVRVYRSLLASG